MMDNFQFWFYIIVAVIYVVSRVMKKSNEQRPRRTTEHREMSQSDRPRSSEPPRERALTFEELLREITEGKSTTQQTPARPAPKPAYVDYDDNLGEEAQDLEDVDYSYQKEDNIYQVYEKAKQDAFSPPSLEDVGAERRPLEFGKFKAFDQEVKRTVLDDIVQELGSPGGARKAVILSEILKPKF